MKNIVFVFLLFIYQISLSQTDSSLRQNCPLQISLLTCTPGGELYSTFGHSALRVVDSTHHTDMVFNYGTFNFDDPAFYSKFIKGKLLYFVSVDPLPDFLYEYRYFKRGVTEQVLHLSCEEKQKLATALYENAKEENKYYRYDFNYDNCTTRLRDMLEKTTGSELQTKNLLPDSSATFRTLIHSYLDKGGQQWSKLGIDILLGSPLDKKITNREAMFLPDYLLMAFDSATLNGKPVVAEKKIMLNYFNNHTSKNHITPLIVFSTLFVLLTVLSFILPAHHLFFKITDFILFFLTGAIGCLLVLMWWGTNHAMCKNNFNLLWALPTHLPAALLLFKKNKVTNRYFLFIFFYSIALLLAWLALPQQLNTALLPVNGIILIRSYFLSKRNRT